MNKGTNINLYFNQIDRFKLEQKAQECGMSLSAYCRYLILLSIGGSDTPVSTNALLKSMLQKMKALPAESTFIVSSLVPDPESWTALSASNKRSLAKKISEEVKQNPKRYQFLYKSGNINFYKKL